MLSMAQTRMNSDIGLPVMDESKPATCEVLLYLLRFEPIYQYRLWGGRRLADLLNAPLPGDGPIGEAWLLSDRDDHQSRVANGPLKGRTIAQLLEQFPEQMLGNLAGRFGRFPLLLKFLDVRKMLSVQVHPTDANTDLLPAGETPKTEAWVVLEAGTESRIYAGLKPGTTAASLRHALTNGTVADQLASLTPKPADAIFLRAGTVHSLGGGVVVFEIQQNSDVTFRLYDWNHVDPNTGKPRALQVEKAMACVDFSEGPVGRVTPVVETKTPVERERLFDCEHSGYGDCADNRRLPSAPPTCRAYWCASREQGRSNTAAPLTQSERATYLCCLRRSERVFFGPSEQ
jgi:mannose-6-phosphate isomerase